MKPEDFKTLLDTDSNLTGGGPLTHITDAGIISVTDIESREVKKFTFENGDVMRVLLTVKGHKDPILVPLMVWGQLRDMLKAKPTMTAFSVTRSGAGKQTKYMIVPETTP